MTQQKFLRTANSHPGPNGCASGHGPAFTERGGVPAFRDHAASDDASGTLPACAAALPAAAGSQLRASTVREAYAEVAPPAPNETAQKMLEKTSTRAGSTKRSRRTNSANLEGEEEEIPAGQYPLPETPGEFVEEIHRKVDITEVWHRLLCSKDKKIRQRAVERLTDLFYKGDPTSAEDPQQIMFDLPGPKRD